MNIKDTTKQMELKDKIKDLLQDCQGFGCDHCDGAMVNIDHKDTQKALQAILSLIDEEKSKSYNMGFDDGLTDKALVTNSQEK